MKAKADQVSPVCLYGDGIPYYWSKWDLVSAILELMKEQDYANPLVAIQAPTKTKNGGEVTWRGNFWIQFRCHEFAAYAFLWLALRINQRIKSQGKYDKARVRINASQMEFNLQQYSDKTEVSVIAPVVDPLGRSESFQPVRKAQDGKTNRNVEWYFPPRDWTQAAGATHRWGCS